MTVKRINLGWITASNLQKTKELFVDKLGMTLSSEAEEMGWIEVQGKEGGALLGIAQSNDDVKSHKPGHNTVLTFTVDDIEKTKKELEERGVRFTSEIMVIPGHVKLVNFVDDDSNLFQLAEML